MAPRVAELLAGFALISAAPLLAQPITAPTINAVVGAADNSGGAQIPRGSLFTIYGLNLAPSAAGSTGFPLSPILNGVRVHVDGFDALPLYVSEVQINALMPSAMPEGQHAVTVEPEGVASAPYEIKVVTARFAAFTENWLGMGPAVLQQYDEPGRVSRNRFLHGARPGQAMVLWGTGLGPLPAGSSDSNPPAAGNIRDDVVVYVAGIPVKPFYAGRSPSLAGVDQINFFLPAGLPERCMVPLAVSAAGNKSGTMTLSVSRSGSACTSEFGLSTAALGKLDLGGSVRFAVISINKNQNPNPSQYPAVEAEAWIGDYDAVHLALLATTDLLPDAFGSGACFSQNIVQDYSQPPLANLIDIHGQIGLPGLSAAVQLTGSVGCSWAASGPIIGSPWQWSSNSCTPTAFSFSAEYLGQPALSASGDLPATPPDSTIANFTVGQFDGSWRAAWQITGPTANGRLALTAQSSWSLGGAMFFGRSYLNTLTCNVNPARDMFLFPQPDISNAFSEPQNHTVTINLTSMADSWLPTGVPAGGAVDVLLIRTGNNASQTIQLGY